jgi:folate-binding protein YgfZ
MTAELFQQIERDGAAVDLSARAKWLLTGADRVRYLNGQVTNDVRRATASEALYACVTNAKGRIEGDLFIHAAPDEALCLDAEPGLREPLSARLEKYIVSDDVIIADVSDEWKLFHVFAAAADKVAVDIAFITTDKYRIVRNNRFGIDGCDIWMSASEPLPDFSVPLLSPEEIEVWRICRGIPRWPQELNASSFPQEAGLETRAMDFSKGCYIGQEVLSRIKSTGRMPRKMVKFQVHDPAGKTQLTGAPGASGPLWVRSAEGLKEAGAVTSICLHPVLDQVIGLAYVRQGLEQEHSLLLAPEGPSSILIEVKISG